jgi:hypothetical protein
MISGCDSSPVMLIGAGAGGACTIAALAGRRVPVAVPGFFGLAGVPEIGSVPAAAFQLESGGRKEFPVTGLTTFGADREWRVTDFLQMLLLKTASRTAIFVNRHDSFREKIKRLL